MPDEKKKNLPEQGQGGYCFDETTCSPEFGNEGCKKPVNPGKSEE